MGLINEAQNAFATIYDGDLWGLATGEWSAERPGEEPEAERITRLAGLIQDLIRDNEIKSVVEFGCGFWSYARQVDWTGVSYDGFDVVDGIITHNTAQYGTDNIRFHRVTDGVRLPPADLLISKDVLQHLPLSHVQHYLGIFKRNFRLMLLANDVIPDTNLNGDTPAGGYRALRFELPPFNERNAVLRSWVSSDFGVRTVKHFCLLFGEPVPDQHGAILRDEPEELRPATVSGRPRSIRTAAGDLVRRVPPLARLSGYILERISRP